MQEKTDQQLFDEIIKTARREDRLNVLIEVAEYVCALEDKHGVNGGGKANILVMIARLGKK